MCLAVPLRIKEINGEDAVAERDGVSRKIKVGFIQDPKPGDYVIVHAGFAIERVDEQQAIDDLEAWREFQEAINS
jgi:hydrogenase expression/formation protein HypC